MRKILFICAALLLAQSAVWGQDVAKKKTKLEKALEKGCRKILSKVDLDQPGFVTMEAPQKWVKESAVVLLNFTKIQRMDEKRASPSGSIWRIYNRKRILLQDQFAINDFSYFQISKGEYLEITVIKPDGTKFILDKSKAVSSDTRLEDFSFLNYVVLNSEQRIPVPNLEPGDIIEIERFWENVAEGYNGQLYRTAFSNYYSVIELNDRYPTYQRIIEYELNAANRISWKSLNGAPDLQSVKIKKDYGYYRFQDSLRDRVKGEYWSPGLLKQPSIKYALTQRYTRNDFSHRSFEPLKEVTSDDIKSSVYELISKRELIHSGVIREFVLAYKNEEMDDETYINRFYEFYRAHFYFRVAEDFDDKINNARFFMIMKGILEKRKIEYDILVGIPRDLGTLDQIISSRELTLGLRIRESGEIIHVFNAYSTMGEVGEDLLGTEVYVLNSASKYKRLTIEKERLPSSQFDQHVYSHDIRASLLPGYTKIKLEVTNKMKGLPRYNYMSRMPYTLFNADLSLLYGEDALRINLSPVYYEDMEKEELKEEEHRVDTMFRYTLTKVAKKKMERSHGSKYFEVADYEELTVLKNGRSYENKELEYKEVYEIEGLSGRAGNYYVIELGRLLGNQMEIVDSEDSIRTQDIYFGYPRTIEYTLKFDLPPGMQVEGLDQFNVNVDNEAGAYIVSSEINNGMLIVKAKKVYKAALLDKSDWPKVLEFIDAASELNNKKIILKR